MIEKQEAEIQFLGLYLFPINWDSKHVDAPMIGLSIYTAMLWLCITITAHSAPLSFVPQTLVQPNGDTIHVFASGDEFYNWVHDKDNFTILLIHRQRSPILSPRKSIRHCVSMIY